MVYPTTNVFLKAPLVRVDLKQGDTIRYISHGYLYTVHLYVYETPSGEVIR